MVFKESFRCAVGGEIVPNRSGGGGSVAVLVSLLLHNGIGGANGQALDGHRLAVPKGDGLSALNTTSFTSRKGVSSGKIFAVLIPDRNGEVEVLLLFPGAAGNGLADGEGGKGCLAVDKGQYYLGIFPGNLAGGGQTGGGIRELVVLCLGDGIPGPIGQAANDDLLVVMEGHRFPALYGPFLVGAVEVELLG